eukprot:1791149-Pyramimonas_sp.AAC.1
MSALSSGARPTKVTKDEQKGQRCKGNLGTSYQPVGPRWSSELPMSCAKALFPSGRYPIPSEGNLGRAEKWQDGSKRASDAPRWPSRRLDIAPFRFRCAFEASRWPN